MIRVILIAAMTADGFIGRDANHLADWTSREDKQLFVRLTKRAGVMIMGANTFATIGRALPGRRTIVYTHGPFNKPDVEATTEAPRDLVARLEREGCREVAICGGRAIYDLFLQAGAVDELYVTVEPLLFGSGVSLAAGSLAAQLALREVEKLNDNTIMLHYEVQK